MRESREEITTAKLAAGAVTRQQICANTICANTIAAESIPSDTGFLRAVFELASPMTVRSRTSWAELASPIQQVEAALRRRDSLFAEWCASGDERTFQEFCEPFNL